MHLYALMEINILCPGLNQEELRGHYSLIVWH